MSLFGLFQQADLISGARQGHEANSETLEDNLNNQLVYILSTRG